MAASMKTVAIVQARMGSTRLPNKVLVDIEGTPLLTRVIERTRAAQAVDELVVATTTEAADDQLEEFMRASRVPVFRGDRDDVLDRFYQCAVHHGAEVIVRVTADDPLKDPEVVERACAALTRDPALDYCSNTIEPSYPEGLDIEVFRFEALARAWREARLPSEREHVTPYIWKHPEIFRIENFRFERDLSSWRWTVDKANDVAFMRAVFAHFAGAPLIGFREIIEWLDANPAVRAINSDTIRNEGYFKSLQSE
jgi:spore coat polysaccharide biosynthesis protein SpsF